MSTKTPFSSIRIDLEIKQLHYEFQELTKIEHKIKDVLLSFYDIQEYCDNGAKVVLEKALMKAEQATSAKLSEHNNLVGQF